jgi:hypothetical protein
MQRHALAKVYAQTHCETLRSSQWGVEVAEDVYDMAHLRGSDTCPVTSLEGAIGVLLYGISALEWVKVEVQLRIACVPEARGCSFNIGLSGPVA